MHLFEKEAEMSNQDNYKGGSQNSSGSQNQPTLQANDIKKLVQNQGKANCAGRDCVLKNPTHNDAQLQSIIKDPSFTAKPIGTPNEKGEWSYQLTSGDKSLKVTII